MSRHEAQVLIDQARAEADNPAYQVQSFLTTFANIFLTGL